MIPILDLKEQYAALKSEIDAAPRSAPWLCAREPKRTADGAY